MLYEKFIKLVEEHHEQLTAKWLNEVQNNPSTPGYHKMSKSILTKRVNDLYRRLGKWILKENYSDSETVEHFISLGRERANEGLKASEVIYAIILTRAVLWKYVINQGVINTSIELHQALEFYHRVNNFFDKAAYYVAVGYETPKEEKEADKHKENFIEGAVDAVARWLINYRI